MSGTILSMSKSYGKNKNNEFELFGKVRRIRTITKDPQYLDEFGTRYVCENALRQALGCARCF